MNENLCALCVPRYGLASLVYPRAAPWATPLFSAGQVPLTIRILIVLRPTSQGDPLKASSIRPSFRRDTLPGPFPLCFSTGLRTLPDLVEICKLLVCFR